MATAQVKAKKTPVKKAATKKVAAKKAPAKKVATKKPVASKAELKFAEKAQENARNVFLAGLGFYGKAIEDAQSQMKENRNKLEQSREKATDLFEELVKRGEKVETTAKKKLKKIDLPELKIPEMKLTDRDELRAELRTRLDKARDSFNTLRDAVSSKSEAA